MFEQRLEYRIYLTNRMRRISGPAIRLELQTEGDACWEAVQMVTSMQGAEVWLDDRLVVSFPPRRFEPAPEPGHHQIGSFNAVAADASY